jgi:hypothetical protein
MHRAWQVLLCGIVVGRIVSLCVNLCVCVCPLCQATILAFTVGQQAAIPSELVVSSLLFHLEDMGVTAVPEVNRVAGV